MKVLAYIFCKPHKAGLIKSLISATFSIIREKVMANCHSVKEVVISN